MSTDPERAPEPLAEHSPEGEDALVARLRALRWPSVDESTRERALERFRKLVAERPPADGSDV